MQWTLTEYGSGEHQNRTFALASRMSKVGRSPEADLVVTDNSVSKLHAEIEPSEGGLCVRDLESRNGTFVNCRPIQRALLKEGDIVQFANAVYRVGRRDPLDAPQTAEEGILPWAQTLLLFDKLITERAVVPHYQPIVLLGTAETVGYEVLARSNLEGLKQPYAMFQAADRLNQNATLSELMRDEALRIIIGTDMGRSQFFLNTHPCEVVTDRLIDSLRALRARYPDTNIMLEIHEGAVVEPAAVHRIRGVLTELDMLLSYDDFGAGQGRLVELGEIPPDVLKFDMAMIRDIDKAPASKQEVLATLVQLANDLGCKTLAEGVETREESDVCLQMGFHLGQGFFYGRPVPVAAK